MTIIIIIINDSIYPAVSKASRTGNKVNSNGSRVIMLTNKHTHRLIKHDQNTHIYNFENDTRPFLSRVSVI